MKKAVEAVTADAACRACGFVTGRSGSRTKAECRHLAGHTTLWALRGTPLHNKVKVWVRPRKPATSTAAHSVPVTRTTATRRGADSSVGLRDPSGVGRVLEEHKGCRRAAALLSGPKPPVAAILKGRRRGPPAPPVPRPRRASEIGSPRW